MLCPVFWIKTGWSAYNHYLGQTSPLSKQHKDVISRSIFCSAVKHLVVLLWRHASRLGGEGG